MTAVILSMARALVAVAGVLLLVMTAVTFADVVGRYFFSRPVPVAFELVQAAMATLVFCALPLVTLEEGHVSMGLLGEALAGWWRRVQRLAAFGIGAMVAAFWAVEVWKTAGRLARNGESLMFSGIPVAPFGYVMAAMIGLSAALMALSALRPGPMARRPE
ncbi:MAG: TRAP transporter small permease [Thermaurantiacus sp.]